MKTQLLITLLFITSYFQAQTAPTGESPQTFCNIQMPTLSDVVVQGENLTWYDAATGGNILPTTTALVNNTFYWVAQGTAPEAERLEIQIHFNYYIPAPMGDTTQEFCGNDISTISDLMVENTSGFSSIYWCDSPNLTLGNFLSPDTILQNGATYYAYQTQCNCVNCVGYLPVSVTIDPYIPIPVYQSPVYFCNADTITINDLIVDTWGLVFSLDPNFLTTIPSDYIFQNGDVIYFRTQVLNTCTQIYTIEIFMLPSIPAPFGYENQIFCNTITLADAYCFNTFGGNDVTWASLVNPMDPTTVIVQDGVTYYAYQAEGDCVNMLPVTFHQVANILAPVGNSTQNVLQNGDVTFAELAVFNTTGFSDIYWYADAEQIVKINPNTQVENGTYFAFQGIGSCCTPLSVNVNRLASIPAPVAESPQQHCQTGSYVGDINYENTSGFNTIYCFADEQLTQLLNPNTPLQTATYYLTQGLGTNVAYVAVNVQIFPTIPLPLAQSQQYICANNSVTFSDLVVFNTEGYNNIFWADCHCGGMHHMPNDLVTEGLFYASQTMIGCGDTVPVQVHVVSDIPAPIGESVYTYNETDNITFDSVPLQNTSGFNGIVWYADAQQNTPINPNTLVTNGTFYAFQGIGNCAVPLAVQFNVTMGWQDVENTFVKIFPNPANQFVNIVSTNDFSIHSIMLTDFLGQIVFKSTSINSQSSHLDISNLAKGIYFVEVKNNHGVYVEKLIVD